MSGLIQVRRRTDKPNLLEREAIFQKGEVLGCFYGGSVEPTSLYVTIAGTKNLHVGGVYDLKIDGKKMNAVLKEYDRSPIRRSRQHITFQVIGANEKTTINTPIELVGKAIGEKEGGITAQMLMHVDLVGSTKDIPEVLKLDISELHVNHKLSLKDVTLPKGVEWDIQDLETTIAVCNPPKAEPVETEAKEPEVIGEKPEAEEATEKKPE